MQIPQPQSFDERAQNMAITHLLRAQAALSDALNHARHVREDATARIQEAEEGVAAAQSRVTEAARVVRLTRRQHHSPYRDGAMPLGLVPLSVLELDTRTYRALHRAGHLTLGDVDSARTALGRVRNIGPERAECICATLDAYLATHEGEWTREDWRWMV